VCLPSCYVRFLYGPHLPFFRKGNKKGTCERRCTPCVRSIAGGTPTSPVFLSSSLPDLYYANRAQRASLFSDARSIEPRCSLHAITLCTFISWQIKAMQGTYAHAEAWQAALGPHRRFCHASLHLLTGLHTRLYRQDATPGASCGAGHAFFCQLKQAVPGANVYGVRGMEIFKATFSLPRDHS
jgi:hypothetical protein